MLLEKLKKSLKKISKWIQVRFMKGLRFQKESEGIYIGISGKKIKSLYWYANHWMSGYVYISQIQPCSIRFAANYRNLRLVGNTCTIWEPSSRRNLDNRTKRIAQLFRSILDLTCFSNDSPRQCPPCVMIVPKIGRQTKPWWLPKGRCSSKTQE